MLLLPKRQTDDEKLWATNVIILSKYGAVQADGNINRFYQIVNADADYDGHALADLLSGKFDYKIQSLFCVETYSKDKKQISGQWLTEEELARICPGFPIADGIDVTVNIKEECKPRYSCDECAFYAGDGICDDGYVQIGVPELFKCCDFTEKSKQERTEQ